MKWLAISMILFSVVGCGGGGDGFDGLPPAKCQDPVLSKEGGTATCVTVNGEGKVSSTLDVKLDVGSE